MAKAYVAADMQLPVRDWTVGQLLASAADRAPERIALKDGDMAWTYGQLLADTRRLGSFLLTLFQPGEHVAIWGSNSASWTLYQFAAAQAGLILVTLNPALRNAEIHSLLEQSQAVGLLVDNEHRGTDLNAIVEEVRGALPLLRTVLQIADWRSHLAQAPLDTLSIVVSPDDTALILYTSGTTGKPKGVMLHHRGIVNNALLGSERYELDDGLVWMGVLPLFHIGGSVTSTLGCIARLGTNIVVPAFEPGEVLRLIETEHIAWFPCVPTMVISMVEHPDFDTTDLSSLQLVLTGGTMITPDFVRMINDRFKVPVQVMFGQTEAGGAMCKTFRKDSLERICETVGRPYPHTEMRIADILTGETVDCDSIGEIRLRSPFRTNGYFDNPPATADAFDADGYLRTGDLGTLDANGYLRVTGRLKEMIIRGGENIYPREIEDRLGDFEGIAECAVVGIPHERWGEEVAVAIRCNAGKAVDVDAVRDFLIERIARHKVPKHWKIVDDFPRTPSGKIQKFEVIGWFSPEFC